MRSAIYIYIFGLFLTSAPVFAETPLCLGTDLGATIPTAERTRMEAEEDRIPHAKGLIWEARKGDAHMAIIGTYHLDDPRLDGVVQRFLPALDNADALLVEAGPEEMDQLQQEMLRNPEIMLLSEGEESLPQRLDPEVWKELSARLSERGLPPLMSAQMRPWFATLMLSFSPCMLENMAGMGMAGLDARLMDHAEEIDLPIIALEPWNTVFDLFGDLPPDQETALIMSSLSLADMIDDVTATVANAYFDGRSWLVWQISAYLTHLHTDLPPETIAEQLDLTQEVLMTTRNHSWIAPMEEAAEAAATRNKSIAVAVGLLHLPGEEGVLQLLKDKGWDVSPTD